MAVLVMLAVAIFMISRLVAVLAAKPDDGSRRVAAVAERIQKVGEVAVVGSPAPAGSDTASASPVPQQVAVAATPSGEAVYTQACAACHTAGVLQAPKLGSKEQWEPRFAQGLDTLVHNAVNGIRAMPAKGGHPNLTEDDIRSSIVYMLNESGFEVAEATTQVAEAPSPATAEPAAPAQESAPAQEATTAQPAVAAVEAAAPAPTADKSQSVQEVTLAAAEAANAASQAAAAASQAAAAASQAAAAASQAAAAVSQAIDMLREMAAASATDQVKSTVSGPAEKAEPAPAPSAPKEKATEIPRTLSGPAANAPKMPTPLVKAKPAVPVPVEKVAPPAEVQPEPAASTAPVVDPAAAPQEQAATTPPSTEGATPAEVKITVPSDINLARGKQLYNTACVICHQAGVAGAPKLGDKAAWAPRTAQGFDTLVEHSIKGYKGMPPKGGRLDIPNREIRSAVGYMLSELE
jgi:cytochrome c5